jgi:hypothetical protein
LTKNRSEQKRLLCFDVSRIGIQLSTIKLLEAVLRVCCQQEGMMFLWSLLFSFSTALIFSNSSNSTWPSDSRDFTTFPGAPVPNRVAFCSSIEDVQAVLKAPLLFPISVRSGRHCYTLFSLAENGTVIDVSMMNGTSIIESSRLRFGAGALNFEIQLFAARNGFVHVGGTGPHVGVGFVLGGGYSFVSRYEKKGNLSYCSCPLSERMG